MTHLIEGADGHAGVPGVPLPHEGGCQLVALAVHCPPFLLPAHLMRGRTHGTREGVCVCGGGGGGVRGRTHLWMDAEVLPCTECHSEYLWHVPQLLVVG